MILIITGRSWLRKWSCGDTKFKQEYPFQQSKNLNFFNQENFCVLRTKIGEYKGEYGLENGEYEYEYFGFKNCEYEYEYRSREYEYFKFEISEYEYEYEYFEFKTDEYEYEYEYG